MKRFADGPNILYILADQLRHDWLGCCGADHVDTPHIDALAARGRVFSQCSVTSPDCGPSRISLATGLLPTRLGCTDNNSAFMPISAPTIYKHLRDHGYRVENYGRHDLAKPGNPASRSGTRPLNFSYGFTRAMECEGLMSSTYAAAEGPRGPYTNYLAEQGLYETFIADFTRRAQCGWVVGAMDDLPFAAEHSIDGFIGRTVCERIAAIEDDYPWFMQVCFQSPHDPYAPPPEWGARYRDADMPSAIPGDNQDIAGRTQTKRRMWATATEADILRARRQYSAKVAHIDDEIGRVIAALDARGMLDDTIIVVTADHGDQLGDHALFSKSVAFDSSWRTPLIMAGPGITAGRCAALIEHHDLNPTLVELAGLPAQQNLDARSFAAVARGETDAHRDCCVCCQGGFRAVRTETEKLIETYNDRHEYYRFDDDPQELHNRIDDDDDGIRALRRRVQQRFTEGQWMR